ncbi:MAG: class I SAM-dependent rRNA methyltransferase, partial [Acidobacteriaceae bacterium]|nr:class I SAM-dependent rRNA methyltransferase [Acidobacteriaceae bacterium]
MAMPVVRISRKGADRAQSGHPWIFSSDVIDSGTAQAGDAVRVVDYRGKNIGAGHYSSTSQIAVRLLSHAIETIDERFLTRRIESALEYRRRVVSNSNAYRVIHAEGDLLPGLIVDKYSDWLVVQLLNQGMDRMADCVSAVLARLLDPCGIVARNDVTVRAKEALPQDVRLLAGDVPERVPIRLNSYTMHANLLTGQKTGVFLDQRENYLAAQRYARGVALDCFTATGGFGLHLACRCESVEA